MEHGIGDWSTRGPVYDDGAEVQEAAVVAVREQVFDIIETLRDADICFRGTIEYLTGDDDGDGSDAIGSAIAALVGEFGDPAKHR